METLKKDSKGIVIVVLVILAGVFYWFQIRPTQIKKECSWTTETYEADSGITKEQAEINKKIYENCVENNWDCDTSGVVGVEQPVLGRLSLEYITKERAPSPATTEKEEASEEEYNTCLRSRGL